MTVTATGRCVASRAALSAEFKSLLLEHVPRR